MLRSLAPLSQRTAGSLWSRSTRSLIVGASQKRTKFTVNNPATEEIIAEFQEADFENVEEKFEQAQRAQKKWSAVPLQDRINVIQRFQKAITSADNVERLAKITAREVGKPVVQAESEIKALGPRIQFFLDHVTEALQEDIVHESGREKISYEPLGVIGNISAWNYPYFVGTNVFVPALLTGNAVLYKPSEHATLTGVAMAELLHNAGVPKDVFTCFIGSGSVGAEIVAQPLDGVFFTGSYHTGEKINQMAATHMMKVQLELGGKDPVYVTENLSGTIDRAAESLADGAMYNAGQSCCSVERIYVHKTIYKPFVDAFVKAVDKFKMGNPLDRDTYIGPLARAPQRDFLEAQVKDALDKGAKLLRGGARATVDGKGYYFQPTVLTDVDHTMSVMKEESFGPIIGIMAVESDAEALALMNDTHYGLTASVFCADRKRAMNILEQVDAGTVYINKCDSVSPRLPWSGRKRSGIGATLSMIGIKSFLHPKAWNMAE